MAPVYKVAVVQLYPKVRCFAQQHPQPDIRSVKAIGGVLILQTA